MTLKQIPIYVGRYEKGEVTDQFVKGRKGKKHCCSTLKSPKKRHVRPKSLKKDRLRKKNKLKGPSGKYVSASEEARRKEEVIFPEHKSKVRKVKSEDDDSEFECYDKSDWETVTCGRGLRDYRK